MSNIEQYFINGSEKRDLSDTSKDGDDPKKAREGSIDDTTTVDDTSNNSDVFKDDNQSSPTLSTLQQCLFNMEQQIREIRRISESTQESQVKGEGQLAEITKGMKYINEKFKEYEEERKADKEIIKNLEKNLSLMSQRMDVMDKKLDKQEQYSRRNCILIHGIPEKKGEDTDEAILKVIKEDVGESVDISDIDRSHRIGKFRSENPNPRPVIVKFARYHVRRKVFSNKKKLKGKTVSITESLTAKRMEILKKAREELGFKNVWTYDGNIMIKMSVTTKLNRIMNNFSFLGLIV